MKSECWTIGCTEMVEHRYCVDCSTLQWADAQPEQLIAS